MNSQSVQLEIVTDFCNGLEGRRVEMDMTEKQVISVRERFADAMASDCSPVVYLDHAPEYARSGIYTSQTGNCDCLKHYFTEWDIFHLEGRTVKVVLQACNMDDSICYSRVKMLVPILEAAASIELVHENRIHGLVNRYYWNRHTQLYNFSSDSYKGIWNEIAGKHWSKSKYLAYCSSRTCYWNWTGLTEKFPPDRCAFCGLVGEFYQSVDYRWSKIPVCYNDECREKEKQQNEAEERLQREFWKREQEEELWLRRSRKLLLIARAKCKSLSGQKASQSRRQVSRHRETSHA